MLLLLSLDDDDDDDIEEEELAELFFALLLLLLMDDVDLPESDIAKVGTVDDAIFISFDLVVGKDKFAFSAADGLCIFFTNAMLWFCNAEKLKNVGEVCDAVMDEWRKMTVALICCTVTTTDRLSLLTT